MWDPDLGRRLVLEKMWDPELGRRPVLEKMWGIGARAGKNVGP